MVELWKVVVLAIMQGIAEFLPISSSGHLLVLGSWFGFDPESNMTLNVVLHAGTLLAILIYYFKKLLSILLEKKRRRLIGLVIIGSIPAAAVGITLKVLKLDALIFSSPWVAAAGFLITAFLLIKVFNWPWRSSKSSDEGMVLEDMSIRQALLIGCAQAVAVTPGISRSGSTIAAAVWNKLRKADAAEFSFLLAIPAIGGAALLELRDLIGSSPADISGWLNGYLIGFIVSAAVGYAALAGLIAMLRRGKLGWFSCYLFLASAVVFAVQIIKLF
ncbi:MAG: undecaprenyl-diphosphate phosphatase [Lentisphaerae bacterium]|nr:undecaprenyl-diphosphate phosphatase [Lentisphaerota bacterium]